EVPPGGKALNLNFLPGGRRAPPAKLVGRAEQGVETLRPARCKPPAYGRMALRNGRVRNHACEQSPGCHLLKEFAAFHGTLPGQAREDAEYDSDEGQETSQTAALTSIAAALQRAMLILDDELRRSG